MKYLYFFINVSFVILMMWAGWRMQRRYSIEFNGEGFRIEQKMSISIVVFNKIKEIKIKKKSLIIKGNFMIEHRFGERIILDAIEVIDNGGDDFSHLKKVLKELGFL